MRVECPQCTSLSDAHIIEVRGRVVCFSCTECNGHFSHLIASSWQDPTPSPEKMAALCPKCGQESSDAKSACVQCGLACEKFDTFESQQSLEDGNISESWQRLEKEWHSDAAHREFVNSLLTSGGFRVGAAKYRRAASSESRRVRCEEMMDAIQKMAAVALLSSKPKVTKEDGPFGSVILMLVACVVLAAASVVYAMTRKEEGPAVKTKDSTPRVLQRIPKTQPRPQRSR